MAKNLYEQMDELGRQCLAQMLGFTYAGDNDMRACGFRNLLREIRPFADDTFVLGQALDAYLAHQVAARAARQDEPTPMDDMLNVDPDRPEKPADAATAQMDADWKLPAPTRKHDAAADVEFPPCV